MNIETAIKKSMTNAAASRSANTARTYRNGLNKFVEYLSIGNVLTTSPLEDVKTNHFIEFPGWLLEQGYSKNTMQVYISGTHFFMDWLVIHDYLYPSYQETMRYKLAAGQVNRKRERRLPRIPQKGAVDKILQAARLRDIESPRKERDIALVEFLFSTGCRNNEAAQLDIKNVDMVTRSAIVLGKGDKERRVYFSQEAAQALRYYWTKRGYSDASYPVFTRHDDGANKIINHLTNTAIRDIVNACVVAAGLDKGSFTPHYFRHAFAIKMLQKTHDLALTQDLLGHDDPASTRVYATIDPEELAMGHREVFG